MVNCCPDLQFKELGHGIEDKSVHNYAHWAGFQTNKQTNKAHVLLVGGSAQGRSSWCHCRCSQVGVLFWVVQCCWEPSTPQQLCGRERDAGEGTAGLGRAGLQWGWLHWMVPTFEQHLLQHKWSSDQQRPHHFISVVETRDSVKQGPLHPVGLKQSKEQAAPGAGQFSPGSAEPAPNSAALARQEHNPLSRASAAASAGWAL